MPSSFFFFFYLTPNIYTSGPELHSTIQSHPFTTLLHTLSVLVTKETVKWSLGSGAMVWHECFFFLFIIYFISFLSTSWGHNITIWTNDCFGILQVKEASWAFPIEHTACTHACKRAAVLQTLSPDPRRPTCSHHSLSLCDPIIPGGMRARFPRARNLSAATGKRVF